MNDRLRRRLFVVTGVIVVVLAVVLAMVASSTGYQAVSIAEALESGARDSRIQVSGTVVPDSYVIEKDVLTFALFDPEGDQKERLTVRYEGGVSATFGNGVTAICTGKVDSEGILLCSELVTKCPSKYENATDALSVSQLLNYGESIEGKPVKITGLVKPGSLSTVTAEERLLLLDESTALELPVAFTGAIPDTVGDNSSLVVTGSLDSSGHFVATDIALREE